jgi:hypothetical protein
MSSVLLVHESLLRSAWEQQDFQHENLRTTDGRPVQILDSGSSNADGGPDFRGALVRIGGTLYRGDVELHIDASSWVTHGHHNDAHYNQVILHVALVQRAPFTTLTQSKRSIPLLVLERPPIVPGTQQITKPPDLLPCGTLPLRVTPQQLQQCLRRLAHERLRIKVCWLKTRIEDIAHLRLDDAANRPFADAPLQSNLAVRAHWEQLLYEQLLDCLGYGKNRRPMTALARGMRLDILQQFSLSDTITMQALLFGSAGLLPSTRRLPDRDARRYVRSLRRRWREIRHAYTGPVLHEAEWLFFRLRPSNFPTVRLAAMVSLLPLLFGGTGIRRLLQTARARDRAGRELLHDFASHFLVKPEGFWKTHSHFHGIGEGRGAGIGKTRILDILINAIVPVLLLYASVFSDRLVRRNALRLYATMPLLQENTVTIRMRKGLVKGRFRIRNGWEQQGLLQLHNEYCAKRRCEECLVRKSAEP